MLYENVTILTRNFQDDSRSPYGSSYQSGGKSSLPVSEVSRGSPKSSQQSQYAYNQVSFYVCACPFTFTFLGIFFKAFPCPERISHLR